MSDEQEKLKLKINALENKIADMSCQHSSYHSLSAEIDCLRLRLLELENDELKALLREMDKYLNLGTSDTAIHQGSIFHTQIKEVLGK